MTDWEWLIGNEWLGINDVGLESLYSLMHSIECGARNKFSCSRGQARSCPGGVWAHVLLHHVHDKYHTGWWAHWGSLALSFQNKYGGRPIWFSSLPSQKHSHAPLSQSDRELVLKSSTLLFMELQGKDECKSFFDLLFLFFFFFFLFLRASPDDWDLFFRVVVRFASRDSGLLDSSLPNTFFLPMDVERSFDGQSEADQRKSLRSLPQRNLFSCFLFSVFFYKR